MRSVVLSAVATLLLATSAARCPAVSPPAQRLVPAAYGARTDSQGFSWDINQQGSIDDGTNDCFDGGLILTVNGQQFQTQQSQMTADGSELVLTAKRFDAGEAVSIGMVNRVVPQDHLMEETLDMARKISDMPPLSVGLSKMALRRGVTTLSPLVRRALRSAFVQSLLL